MNRYEFIANFQNSNYEPFFNEYSDHLNNLNSIITGLGEPLEGNVFYYHLLTNPSLTNMEPSFLPKRRLYALLANTCSNILEIGFNAGHSALLMLTSNPELSLTSIDLCNHSYTIPCYDYLKSVFNNRINLINSNSTVAFPSLKNQYDCYIIDGGHDIVIADTDLFNIINYSKKGSLIVVDDADHPPIRLLLNMYTLKGLITPISDVSGFIPNSNTMLFINNKSE